MQILPTFFSADENGSDPFQKKPIAAPLQMSDSLNESANHLSRYDNDQQAPLQNIRPLKSNNKKLGKNMPTQNQPPQTVNQFGKTALQSGDDQISKSNAKKSRPPANQLIAVNDIDESSQLSVNMTNANAYQSVSNQQAANNLPFRNRQIPKELESFAKTDVTFINEKIPTVLRGPEAYSNFLKLLLMYVEGVLTLQELLIMV